MQSCRLCCRASTTRRRPVKPECRVREAHRTAGARRISSASHQEIGIKYEGISGNQGREPGHGEIHATRCLARLTGPDVAASAHLGYVSAGRAGMIGDLSGYSYAKRGASPLRLPACRAGQQCVSPPSCRPGPQSSRSGQCFPRSRTKRPSQEGPPPLVLSYCCFLSWRLLRHQFENRDVRLVSHQLLGVGDHATRRQGRAVPWW